MNALSKVVAVAAILAAFPSAFAETIEEGRFTLGGRDRNPRGQTPGQTSFFAAISQ